MQLVERLLMAGMDTFITSLPVPGILQSIRHQLRSIVLTTWSLLVAEEAEPVLLAAVAAVAAECYLEAFPYRAPALIQLL